MGTLIMLPGLQSPSAWTRPTVYTPSRIERMSRANKVARQLRALGYRVIAEDPFPDDGGPSIIQIEVGMVGTRSLQHLGGCAVKNTHTGIESTTIDGVRVLWHIGRA